MHSALVTYRIFVRLTTLKFVRLKTLELPDKKRVREDGTKRNDKRERGKRESYNIKITRLPKRDRYQISKKEKMKNLRSLSMR